MRAIVAGTGHPVLGPLAPSAGLSSGFVKRAISSFIHRLDPSTDECFLPTFTLMNILSVRGQLRAGPGKEPGAGCRSSLLSRASRSGGWRGRKRIIVQFTRVPVLRRETDRVDRDGAGASFYRVVREGSRLSGDVCPCGAS